MFSMNCSLIDTSQLLIRIEFVLLVDVDNRILRDHSAIVNTTKHCSSFVVCVNILCVTYRSINDLWPLPD